MTHVGEPLTAKGIAVISSVAGFAVAMALSYITNVSTQAIGLAVVTEKVDALYLLVEEKSRDRWTAAEAALEAERVNTQFVLTTTQIQQNARAIERLSESVTKHIESHPN